MIGKLKNRFIEIAKSVCPRYKVRDDQKPILNDIFNWCIMANGYYDPKKGLWLCGEIGVGKSTLLEIIKGFCKIVRTKEDRYGHKIPYSFRISNAVEVCGDFAKHGYDGIATYIESDAQAFDEIGSESIPTSHYGTTENVMQYLLQRRYDKRHTTHTHVTTNISKKQIFQMYGPRIYDRCREMFNFVEITGESFRKS